MLIIILDEQLREHVRLSAEMAGVSPQAYMSYLIIKDMECVELTLDRGIVQAIEATAKAQRRTVNQVLVEVISRHFHLENGRVK